jgi:hypothetical protein
MALGKLTQTQINEVKEKASRTLFHTVFGTILPLVIGAIILVLFAQPKDLVSFINDGTICLFAAALLTSATYLFTENSESITSKKDKRIFKYCQPIWIIVAIVYGSLFAKKIFSIDNQINTVFLWIISISCFTFSVVALYRALYVDGLRNPPVIDANKERTDEINEIESQLE